MLITCPTCAAVYRVGDDAIGPSGRNVQCDACGAQWRQEPAAKAAASPAAARKRWDEEEQDAEERAEAVAAEVKQAMDEDAEDEAAEAAEYAAPRVKAPGLEEAAELLQEMREESARSASIDIFGDGAQARPRDAAPEPEPEAEKTAAREDGVESQRKLRTTIASANKRSANAETREGGGFRVGFLLALLFVALLAFAYLANDLLAEQFPGAASILKGYASLVDMIRGGVESAAESAMTEDSPAAQ